MFMEISVDLKTLESCEKELAVLASKIGARQLKPALVRSKGEMADEVRTAVTQMNALSGALKQLVLQTQKAVNRTRLGFTEMDEELAKWFGMGEK